ncbi:hypothetical protein XI09_34370 [Bradyrhizobium sp. CCBAU 11386]|nr:hypothetical protein [Bradyrhizobium sp. CCBAU 11386]
MRVAEAAPPDAADEILGTVQDTAPEYFLEQGGSPRSDMFSLAVICYQMLTGSCPTAPKSPGSAARRMCGGSNIVRPAWVDGALRRALQPDPYKRHEDLSEFVFELRTPNPAYLDTRITPLLERSPLMFWKPTSAALACAVVVLLAMLHAR